MIGADPTSRQQEMVLEPTSGWTHLGLSDVWAHRELLYFLVWRDVKVRYKQTVFGVAWVVLQPALLVLVFSLSLGRLGGVGPQGVSYPLFVLCGLVPWTLFSQGLSAAAGSLVGGESLITKVYFPRLLLPIAAAGSHLVDVVITLALLGVAVASSGAAFSGNVVWLPVLTLIAFSSALGIGTFLAAANVRFRDVRYVVPFLLQIWFFATPVIYSSSLLPTELRGVFALNPMSGVVMGFQWAVFGGPEPEGDMLRSAVISIVVLVVGFASFRRSERTFADIV